MHARDAAICELSCISDARAVILGCRFGVAKSVHLHPLSEAKEFSTTDELKLSFNFDDQRLLVPWITVTDGKGHFLKEVAFYFVHAQGNMRSVKWKTTCQPINDTSLSACARFTGARGIVRSSNRCCIFLLPLSQTTLTRRARTIRHISSITGKVRKRAGRQLSRAVPARNVDRCTVLLTLFPRC